MTRRANGGERSLRWHCSARRDGGASVGTTGKAIFETFYVTTVPTVHYPVETVGTIDSVITVPTVAPHSYASGGTASPPAPSPNPQS